MMYWAKLLIKIFFSFTSKVQYPLLGFKKIRRAALVTLTLTLTVAVLMTTKTCIWSLMTHQMKNRQIVRWLITM